MNQEIKGNPMNKVLVMYYSKNGTTRRYAEWIAEELNGDLFDIKNIKSDMLSGYDVIILGSPILAGTIKGLSIFTKNQNLVRDKKIVYCACGIEDMSNETVTNRIRGYVEKTVSDEIFQKMKIFFLRGGFDHYKLNFMFKLMFWIAKKKVDKKPAEKLTVDDKLVLETYGKNLDFTNKENIKPIVEYCK
ncbi:MAG: flavodoxin domain-containing protein [Bacteroidales bacterium]|jgi:menaquinone-dependent protoporphyrinogen IX oxidase|nr:flavodoxin domain-containing protein [Bacteroidales bacterium]